jgi:hypothetical protein
MIWFTEERLHTDDDNQDRMSRREQVSRVAALAMKGGKSVGFTGHQAILCSAHFTGVPSATAIGRRASAGDAAREGLAIGIGDIYLGRICRIVFSSSETVPWT